MDFNPAAIVFFIDFFLRRFVAADYNVSGRPATAGMIAERKRHEANHRERSARLLDLACQIDRRTWWEAVTPGLDALDNAISAAANLPGHRHIVDGWAERYRRAARTVITRAALNGLGVDTSDIPVGILERLVIVANRKADEGATPPFGPIR